MRIKNENGIFVDNSNIINLLSNATTPTKVLLGQEEFVNLLFKAGVEPELLSNENIRVRLMRLYERNPKKYFCFVGRMNFAVVIEFHNSRFCTIKLLYLPRELWSFGEVFFSSCELIISSDK